MSEAEVEALRAELADQARELENKNQQVSLLWREARTHARTMRKSEEYEEQLKTLEAQLEQARVNGHDTKSNSSTPKRPSTPDNDAFSPNANTAMAVRQRKRAQRELEASEERAAKAEKELLEIGAAFKDRDEEVFALSTQLARLREHSSESSASAERASQRKLEGQVRRLENKLEEVGTTLTTRDEEVLSLRTKLARSREDTSESPNQWRFADKERASVKESEQRAAQAEKKLLEVGTDLENREAEILSLRTDVTGRQEEVVSLRTQLARLREESSEDRVNAHNGGKQDDVIENLETKLQAAEALNSEQLEEMKEVLVEVEWLEGQIAKLKSNSQSDSSGLEGKIDFLSSQLKQEQLKNETLEVESQLKVEQLKNEVAQVGNMMEKYDNRIIQNDREYMMENFAACEERVQSVELDLRHRENQVTQLEITTEEVEQTLELELRREENKVMNLETTVATQLNRAGEASQLDTQLRIQKEKHEIQEEKCRDLEEARTMQKQASDAVEIALRAEISQMEALGNASQEHIWSLEGTLKSTERQLSNMQVEVEQLQQESEVLRLRQACNGGTNDRETSPIRTLQGEIVSLRSQVTARDGRIACLLHAEEHLSADAASLQAEHAAKDRRIAYLLDHEEELVLRQEQLEDLVKVVRAETMEMQARVPLEGGGSFTIKETASFPRNSLGDLPVVVDVDELDQTECPDQNSVALGQSNEKEILALVATLRSEIAAERVNSAENDALAHSFAADVEAASDQHGKLEGIASQRYEEVDVARSEAKNAQAHVNVLLDEKQELEAEKERLEEDLETEYLVAADLSGKLKLESSRLAKMETETKASARDAEAAMEVTLSSVARQECAASKAIARQFEQAEEANEVAWSRRNRAQKNAFKEEVQTLRNEVAAAADANLDKAIFDNGIGVACDSAGGAETETAGGAHSATVAELRAALVVKDVQIGSLERLVESAQAEASQAKDAERKPASAPKSPAEALIKEMSRDRRAQSAKDLKSVQEDKGSLDEADISVRSSGNFTSTPPTSQRTSGSSPPVQVLPPSGYHVSAKHSSAVPSAIPMSQQTPAFANAQMHWHPHGQLRHTVASMMHSQQQRSAMRTPPRTPPTPPIGLGPSGASLPTFGAMPGARISYDPRSRTPPRYI